MNDRSPSALGTDQYRWDLSPLALGLDDPSIMERVRAYQEGARAFERAHKGHLGHTLGQALQDMVTLRATIAPVGHYLRFLTDLNTEDRQAAAVQAKVGEEASSVSRHLVFFDDEVGKLDEATIAALAQADPVVAHHLPLINDIRKNTAHRLAPEIEAVLAEYGPTNRSMTVDLFKEESAALRIPFPDKVRTLEEAGDLLQTETSEARRADALERIDAAFAGYYERLSARILSTILGRKRVSDRQRHYPHAMSWRNQDNMMSDAEVEALHEAVGSALPLVGRYYSLFARVLGTADGKLAWSCRNAPLGLVDDTCIHFDEGKELVLDGFDRFSPTLGAIVRNLFEKRQIDAPAFPGKSGGAYCMPTVMPDATMESFTFMNYQGSPRDVMTLAHELGHGVHNRMAGPAQGILQCHPPIALAETASVFAEAMVFNLLRERYRANDDLKGLFTLLMQSLSDAMNTTIRQTSFSNFERMCHEAGKLLSPADCARFWKEATIRLYGEDGKYFHYRHFDRLWCYVPHFHSPFYVYGYVAGKLNTNSLMSVADLFTPEEFENKYLDALAAGGTKSGVALLAPFGLNPADPTFWSKGLEFAIEEPLAEAEALAKHLGY